MLAAALKISGMKNVVVFSAGTDGSDSPTDAAGAMAGETTLARAQAAGLDSQKYLDNNDSYLFFRSWVISTKPDQPIPM